MNIWKKHKANQDRGAKTVIGTQKLVMKSVIKIGAKNYPLTNYYKPLAKKSTGYVNI